QPLFAFSPADGGTWPQWPLSEHIALHKKVNNHFAVQHCLRFTVLQFEMRKIRTICRIAMGTGTKKVGKTSENRPFCLFQSARLGTTGVSVHSGSTKGNDDGGGKSCCGSGPEPGTGFAWGFLLLRLFGSRPIRPRQPPMPTLSWMPIPEPCCIRPILMPCGIQPR